MNEFEGLIPDTNSFILDDDSYSKNADINVAGVFGTSWEELANIEVASDTIDLEDITANSDEANYTAKDVFGISDEKVKRRHNLKTYLNKKMLKQSTITKKKMESSALNAPFVTKGKISMHELEEIILEYVKIIKINNVLYYFNGRHYESIDKKGFMMLMRKSLPKEIITNISSFSKFQEAYKFADINPKLISMPDSVNMVKSKTMIAFENCLYNASTNEIFDFNKEYPLLFGINANFCDTDLNTPVFDEFVNQIAGGDESVRNLILEMIGYVMLQTIDGKCFFVMADAPNSGKSVLGDFMTALFNDNLVSKIPLQALGEKFALGNIWEKTLNISCDLSATKLSDNAVSYIKSLTGEAKIETQQKFFQSTTTAHHCKMIFATNASLEIPRDDAAFWNRVVIIPFVYSCPEEKHNKNLLYDLLEEKDRIVTKAAMAAHNLISRNYVFTKTHLGEELKQKWRKNTTFGVEEFMCKSVDITNRKDDFIPTEVLYGKYKEFTELENKSSLGPKQLSSTICNDYNLQHDKQRVPELDNRSLNGIAGARIRKEEESSYN